VEAKITQNDIAQAHWDRLLNGKGEKPDPDMGIGLLAVSTIAKIYNGSTGGWTANRTK
jgi:hypothetical protein